jgi:hypothetical protein
MKALILSRLREPSTWAGLAAIVGSVPFLPAAENLQQTVLIVGSAVAGLLAVWLPEGRA